MGNTNEKKVMIQRGWPGPRKKEKMGGQFCWHGSINATGKKKKEK